MSNFRDSSIYVTSGTIWMLAKVVKAQGNENISELAEAILSEWIAAKHPELLEIYKKRQALDEEAAKLLGLKVPF